MRQLAMATLMLTACGGNDPTIDGTWVSPINEVCAIGANFDTKAGTYAAHFMCALEVGGLGDEIESGVADFSVPGKVSIRPTHSSCPTSMHTAETDSYSFGDDGQLVLVTPGSTIIFRRPPDSDGATGAIAFGCWTMGKFFPGTVQPL